MSIKSKKIKAFRYQIIRARRELKRRRIHKLYRKSNLDDRRKDVIIQRNLNKRKTINLMAPKNFSFIDNTNEVLDFFKKCKTLLHRQNNVSCDLSDITSLSSDAIALLAACTNDKSFLGGGRIKGNAPKNQELCDLFVQSGFYNYVNANKILKDAYRQDKNFFHQESNFKVQPEIAKKACLLGVKHITGSEKFFLDLYEMLIEAMSNTNNHANANDKAVKIKWWLYTYNEPNGHTFYTFIDLGVGIFDSLPVNRYRRLKKIVGKGHNIDIVKDLIDGKIKSRATLDNDIRGKGIPQIVSNSEKSNFTRAYIISNNVKINLKSQKAEKLNNDFSGTLLFWELTNL